MSDVDWKDHQRRANELGDGIRRFLITVNTGGIGAMFALAGSLVDKHDIKWVVWPGAAFSAGIWMVGWSMIQARKREIARENAVRAKLPPPEFPRWKMSYPYHNLSLILFVVGVLVGLVELSRLNP